LESNNKLASSRPTPVLVVQDIRQRFGGLVALDGVGFDVSPGEVLGIIGPNGAGKTTLFRIIAGEQVPWQGSITLKGQRITGLPTHTIRRMGIAVTHQIEDAFKSMSVFDNIMVAALFGAEQSTPFEAAAEQVEIALQTTGLTTRYADRVTDLNVVDRKRVELARAIVNRPAVLMLDELFSGINLEMVRPLARAIIDISNMGTAVIIVEHLMGIVRALCPRIIMLSEGRLLTQGTPDEVFRDPRVITSYLGEAHA
jgi:branched-chain amino acid transport system ATP-binding protein